MLPWNYEESQNSNVTVIFKCFIVWKTYFDDYPYMNFSFKYFDMNSIN